MEPTKPDRGNTASKVKGPIRCHKCQYLCPDAEHYLSHKCEPKGGTVSYSSLMSERK